MEHANIMAKFLGGRNYDSKTQVLVLGSAGTSKNLLHIKDANVSEDALLWIEYFSALNSFFCLKSQLCPIPISNYANDDSIGGQIHTPGQCSCAEHYANGAFRKHFLHQIPIMSC
jgi:hypothetical protein